ncbi:hypothetical protein [Rosistilla oblonga]|uniref:hypothetical protein n=1 Tax=Rosistilla oblonga TaxID=2527990 RepID=UPI0011A1E7AD|nr:hypothetical protein [Rosistilla oblonga]
MSMPLMGNNLENFEQTVQRVTEAVLGCIRQREGFKEVIVSEPDCIYVKSANGVIQQVNTAYHGRFSAGADPAGKSGVSYLHPSVVDASHRSDKMILGGCSSVLFNHQGEDQQGRSLRYRTYKRSLQEAGDPRYAILGITRVMGIVGTKVNAASMLSEKWQRFEQLSPEDRQIAIAMASSDPAAALAERGDVPHGRLKSRREAILKTLQIESEVELIKLLVRLQDNGFGNLGI